MYFNPSFPPGTFCSAVVSCISDSLPENVQSRWDWSTFSVTVASSSLTDASTYVFICGSLLLGSPTYWLTGRKKGLACLLGFLNDLSIR